MQPVSVGRHITENFNLFSMHCKNAGYPQISSIFLEEHHKEQETLEQSESGRQCFDGEEMNKLFIHLSPSLITFRPLEIYHNSKCNHVKH